MPEKAQFIPYKIFFGCYEKHSNRLMQAIYVLNGYSFPSLSFDKLAPI